MTPSPECAPHERPRTDAVTAKRMSRQKRKDTAPEISLRRELRARGVGYRINVPIPGLPRRSCDIMFKTARIAVFVDGCFWHGCPTHGTIPRNNKNWWAEKLEINVRRDRETDDHLLGLGWTVIRIWEHEDPSQAAELIVNMLCESRNRVGRAGLHPRCT